VDLIFIIKCKGAVKGGGAKIFIELADMVPAGNSVPVLRPFFLGLKPGPWLRFPNIPHTVRDVENNLFAHSPGKDPRFHSLHFRRTSAMAGSGTGGALFAAGAIPALGHIF
jgi:hypothetical protein